MNAAATTFKRAQHCQARRDSALGPKSLPAGAARSDHHQRAREREENESVSVRLVLIMALHVL
jgi:hypothetical protein